MVWNLFPCSIDSRTASFSSRNKIPLRAVIAFLKLYRQWFLFLFQAQQSNVDSQCWVSCSGFCTVMFVSWNMKLGPNHSEMKGYESFLYQLQKPKKLFPAIATNFTNCSHLSFFRFKLFCRATDWVHRVDEASSRRQANCWEAFPPNS